jgi:hypothetical protein
MIHITLPLQHSPSLLTASLLAVSGRHSRGQPPNFREYIVVGASYPTVAGDACPSR